MRWLQGATLQDLAVQARPLCSTLAGATGEVMGDGPPSHICPPVESGIPFNAGRIKERSVANGIKSLSVGRICNIVSLVEKEVAGATLAEQIAAHLSHDAPLVLDITEIRLTSLRIGELLNLHSAFQDPSKGEARRMIMLDRAGQNHEVLKRVRLDERLPVTASLDEAYALVR